MKTEQKLSDCEKRLTECKNAGTKMIEDIRGNMLKIIFSDNSITPNSFTEVYTLMYDNIQYSVELKFTKSTNKKSNNEL